jgi:hypothetical protein
MIVSWLRRRTLLAATTLVGLGACALALSAPASVARGRCAPPSSPRAELAWASAVFRGVATRIEPVADSHPSEFDVRFTVSYVWKGDVVRYLTVRTWGIGMGYDFQPGTDYLVYAVRPDRSVDPDLLDMLYVPDCTRTAPYAPEEAQELGPGRAVPGLAYLPLTLRR